MSGEAVAQHEADEEMWAFAGRWFWSGFGFGLAVGIPSGVWLIGWLLDALFP